MVTYSRDITQSGQEPTFARNTHVLGSEAGGAAGARMATRLRMALSGDTVLRILHRPPAPPPPTPRVLGIDDCALRKGRVYGTILVDLERRRPVDLLPERTAETVATWVRDHPGVDIMARDRAQDCTRGATEGAPEATQVADRFHLLCNLHEVLTRYGQRITPARRRVLAREPAATSPAIPEVPEPPARAPATRPLPRSGRSPRLQQEQRARHAARTQRYEQVKPRLAQGQSRRQIAAACGLNTKTIRRWVRTEPLPFDQRGSRGTGKIDPYIPSLQSRLAEGCTNQSRLWREMQHQGFTGTRSLVAKWMQAHRQPTAVTPAPAAPQLPAACQRAWLLCQDAETQSADAQALVAQLQQHTELTPVQQLVQQGTARIRPRQAADLDAWLQSCQASPSVALQNFVAVLQRDDAAGKAALTLPWSNGPVEGHINRLKLIKRSGYGRMQLDLLRQRVLDDAV